MFSCWTLRKLRNQATPEWLVSEDGAGKRHLDKNEAISEVLQLCLTPNLGYMRSKSSFCASEALLF